MVEVTQADRQLSALIIKCSEVEHGAKLIASHREAAAKAERDRLRDLPDALKVCGLLYSRDPEIDLWPSQLKMIATALADALEKRHD